MANRNDHSESNGATILASLTTACAIGIIYAAKQAIDATELAYVATEFGSVVDQARAEVVYNLRLDLVWKWVYLGAVFLVGWLLISSNRGAR